MQCVGLWAAGCLALAVLGLPGAAAAEVIDVDCGSLEHIRIAAPESYDETYCMAGSLSGLVTGESVGVAGGPLELIVAVNRATFVVVRFDGSNHHTFMRLPSVQQHVESAIPVYDPRDWGEERRHERFAIADFRAKVTEGSPHLSCVGFLARLRPAANAPGYREAVSGAYCAMDTLTPTEAEVAAFLDGIEF